jgi:hypothetical protein
MKELPIACSLGADELADRADRWRELAEREALWRRTSARRQRSAGD